MGVPIKEMWGCAASAKASVALITHDVTAVAHPAKHKQARRRGQTVF